MDWFHCNRCFRQEGARFAVTSCGHVLCAACGGAGRSPFIPARWRQGGIPPPLPPMFFPHKRHFWGGSRLFFPSRRSVPRLRRRLPLPPHLRQGELPPCPGRHFEPFSSSVLAAILNPPSPSVAGGHLVPSPQMRPQEKLFFKSPAAIALKHLTHISQVWRFQRAQSDLLLASHQEAARRARVALEDARRVLDARHRGQQVSPPPRRGVSGGLRRRHPRVSPRRSSTPRPVGITSPAQTVTPQPRRQLSGQVVSRSSPLEPPPSRRTPVWQVRPPQNCRRVGWAAPIGGR
ncbi:E3 ubiquitin-protein ligase RNF212B [Calonectris borealis]|uniref:E3 ubiquitin-protein ligase RNF212B n=1 Tax=Calonectris borealis TaxID=1323832 RepID=UPI003F4AFC1C